MLGQMRSHYCGKISEEDKHQEATVTGWVQGVRDMGGVLFVDLRDKTGILQVVFNIEEAGEETFSLAETLKNEYVIRVSGNIEKRDEETYNPNIETGTIELRAKNLEVLSRSKTLPFPIEDKVNIREEIRFTHRYLDLRRKRLYNNLALRHKTVKSVRKYLDDLDFMEVETPILTKSTPEGARDYLVPSRLHQGQFYALPQSPQIFKQLLMVSGIDSYYQIAKCFRDEDLRADRQPEFTQVDLELSFLSQDEILDLIEGLFKKIFRDVLALDFKNPFPRLSYQEAMDLYGSDKPDLRFDMKIVDLCKIAKDCDFKVFRNVIDKGGAVRALNIKGGNSLTRSEIDHLTKLAVDYGAQGMAWIAIEEDGKLRTILDKFLTEKEIEGIIKETKAEGGDMIIFCADSLPIVHKTLGNLRLYLGEKLGLIEEDAYEFLIVYDFPLLEWSETSQRYLAMHHPFTMPVEEDKFLKEEDLDTIRARSYDFVLNGVELGSGSIRIYREEIQRQMFKVLGLSDEDIKDRFGFILEAFSYGTPPHGGFAFGLDRLLMLMTKSESIRDVIAFPKTKDGSCLLSQAPSFVDKEQLDVLGLTIGDMDSLGKEDSAREITKELEDLSKLDLEERERQEIESSIKTLIEETSIVKEVDTRGIRETINVKPIVNALRKDIVKKEFTSSELLASSPSQEDDYILVPKVIE